MPAAPTVRDDSAPRDQLDANDRREIRATRSQEDLDLQIRLENHDNNLAWQKMLRELVFYGGLTALTGSLAFVLKFAGLSAAEIARIALAGIIGSLGGYGLRGFAGKVFTWMPRRGRWEREEDQSDRESRLSSTPPRAGDASAFM
jgi:hypothetical protein